MTIEHPSESEIDLQQLVDEVFDDAVVAAGIGRVFREWEWIRDRLGRFVRFIGRPWQDLWGKDARTGAEVPNFAYGGVYRSTFYGDKVTPRDADRAAYIARIASGRARDGSVLLEVGNRLEDLGRRPEPSEDALETIGGVLPDRVPVGGSVFIRRPLGEENNTFELAGKGRAVLAPSGPRKRAEIDDERIRLWEGRARLSGEELDAVDVAGAVRRGAGLDELGYSPVEYDPSDEWWQEKYQGHINEAYQLYYKYMDRYGIASEAMSLKEFADAAGRGLKERLSRQIRVQAPRKVLGLIIDGRALKTQFETKTSMGLLNAALRMETEFNLLGVPEDIADELRPVYGYLFQPDEKNKAERFGELGFVLRESARGRATLTGEDSLAVLSPATLRAALLADAPVESVLMTASPDTVARAALQAEGFLQSFRYHEAQIHGGVPLSDIERIVIREKDLTDSPGLRSATLRGMIAESGAADAMRFILRNLGINIDEEGIEAAVVDIDNGSDPVDVVENIVNKLLIDSGNTLTKFSVDRGGDQTFDDQLDAIDIEAGEDSYESAFDDEVRSMLEEFDDLLAEPGARRPAPKPKPKPAAAKPLPQNIVAFRKDFNSNIAKVLSKRGLSVKTTFEQKAENIFGIDGEIVDAKGNVVGTFKREIHSDFITNDNFKIDKSLQGQGLGKELTDAMNAAYLKNGYSIIRIPNANKDVGGYAWARIGFDYDWGMNPEKYARDIDVDRLFEMARDFGNESPRFDPDEAMQYTPPGGVIIDPFGLVAKALDLLRRTRNDDPDLADDLEQKFRDYLKRLYNPDPDPSKRVTPLELAKMGYTEGAGDWFGKRLLMGDAVAWRGVMDITKKQQRGTGGDDGARASIPEKPEDELDAVDVADLADAPRGIGWDLLGYQPKQFNPDNPGDTRNHQNLLDAVRTGLTFRFTDLPEELATDEGLARYLAEAVREQLSGPIVVAAPRNVLGAIIASRAVKSQFETDASRGLLDRNFRSVVEQGLMGVPAELPDHLRPIYGYVSHPTPPRWVEEYGELELTVNETVTRRATTTLSDSIAEQPARVLSRDMVATASPESLVSVGQVFGLTEIVAAKLRGESYNDYSEVQIHGGLPLQDIKEIKIKESKVFFDENALSDAEAELSGLLRTWGLRPGGKELQEAAATVKDRGTMLDAVERLVNSAIRRTGNTATFRIDRAPEELDAVDVRLDAVDIGKAGDVPGLMERALRGDLRDAYAASTQIDDQQLLATIALESKYAAVRELAAARVVEPDLLISIAKNSLTFVVADNALERIDDQDVLADVAINGVAMGARWKASRRITDQALLVDLALHADDPSVRAEAVRKVDDQNVIERVLLDPSDASKRAKLAAIDRVQSQDALVSAFYLNSDAEIITNIVNRLDDQRLLASVAEDRSMGKGARLNAVKKLQNQNVLERIMTNPKESNYAIRLAAAARVEDLDSLKTFFSASIEQMPGTVRDDPDLIDAFKKLNDDNFLRALALNKNIDRDLRKVAVSSIEDGNVLAELASGWMSGSNSDEFLAQYAVAFIEDNSVLYSLFSNSKTRLKEYAAGAVTDPTVAEAMLKDLDSDPTKPENRYAFEELIFRLKYKFPKNESQPILYNFITTSSSQNFAAIAANGLTDQSMLKDVVAKTSNNNLRIRAIENLTDQQFIADLILSSRSPEVRDIALDQLIDAAALKRVIAKEKDRRLLDKARKRFAASRIAQPIAEQIKNEVRKIFPESNLRFEYEEKLSAEGTDDDTFDLTIDIYDENDEKIGYIYRQIFTEKMEVDNRTFHVEETYQGGGRGKKLTFALKDMYAKNNIKAMRTIANMDVGTYAWGRLGFDFDWENNGGEMFSGDIPVDEYAIMKIDQEVIDGDLTTAEAEEIKNTIRQLMVAANDPDINKRPEPLDFANLGYIEGASTWFGKRLLLDGAKENSMSWWGIQRISPLEGTLEDLARSQGIPDAAVAQLDAVDIGGFPVDNQDLMADALYGDLNEAYIAAMRITDDALLAELVFKAKHQAIREVVVGRITDENFLADIAKRSDRLLIVDAAVERITDQSLLQDIAYDAKTPEVRWKAARMLTEKDRLEHLARWGNDPRVRAEALRRIDDQSILEDALLNASNTLPRIVAAERVQDQNVLQSVLGQWNTNKELSAAVVKRLENQEVLASVAVYPEYDDQSRLNAISLLDNQIVLEGLMLDEDEARNIRTAAAKRVQDQEALKNFVDNFKGRWAPDLDEIISKIDDQDFLLEKALASGSSSGLRTAAVDALDNDDSLLKVLKMLDPSEYSHHAAIEQALIRIKDQNKVFEFFTRPESVYRRAAAASVKDPDIIHKMVAYIVDNPELNVQLDAADALFENIAENLPNHMGQQILHDFLESVEDTSSMRLRRIGEDAIPYMKDQQLLSNLLKGSDKDNWQALLLGQVNDPDILADFVLSDADEFLRARALDRISELSALDRIIDNAVDSEVADAAEYRREELNDLEPIANGIEKAIKEIFGSDFTVEMTKNLFLIRDGSIFYLKADFYDENGMHAGYIERTINSTEEVENTHFELGPEYQKGGRGKRLTKLLDKFYAENGITTLRTVANIDVGAYVWTRLGFDFDWSRNFGDMFDAYDDFEEYVKNKIKSEVNDRTITAEEGQELKRKFKQLMKASRDPDIAKRPKPEDFALLGYALGATDWFGKRMLIDGAKNIDLSWHGVKRISPAENKLKEAAGGDLDAVDVTGPLDTPSPAEVMLSESLAEAAADAADQFNAPAGWKIVPLGDGSSDPVLWRNPATGQRMVVKVGLDGKYEQLEIEVVASHLLRRIGLTAAPDVRINDRGTVVLMSHVDDAFPGGTPAVNWVKLTPEERLAAVNDFPDPRAGIRMLLADIALVNIDRHGGNVMVARDARGVAHLVPIDNGDARPLDIHRSPKHLKEFFDNVLKEAGHANIEIFNLSAEKAYNYFLAEYGNDQQQAFSRLREFFSDDIGSMIEEARAGGFPGALGQAVLRNLDFMESDRNSVVDILFDEFRQFMLAERAPQSELKDIALNHPDVEYRTVAARHLRDQEALEFIMVNDPDLEPRWEAVRNITNKAVRADYALNDWDENVRRNAVEGVDDQDILKEIIINDDDNDVRLAAIRNVKDQKFLEDLFFNANDWRERLVIIDAITDQDLLEKILDTDTNPDLDDVETIKAIGKITNLDVLKKFTGKKLNHFVKAAARRRILELETPGDYSLDAVDVDPVRELFLEDSQLEAVAQAMTPSDAPEGWQAILLHEGYSQPAEWRNPSTGERMIVKRGINDPYLDLEKEVIATEVLRRAGVVATPAAAVNEAGTVAVISHADDLFPDGARATNWGKLTPMERYDAVAAMTDPLDGLRIMVADIALRNTDRHPENLMVKRDRAGRAFMVPIDHGSSLQYPYDDMFSTADRFVEVQPIDHANVELFGMVLQRLRRERLVTNGNDTGEADRYIRSLVEEETDHIVHAMFRSSVEADHSRTDEQKIDVDDLRDILFSNLQHMTDEQGPVVDALMDLYGRWEAETSNTYDQWEQSQQTGLRDELDAVDIGVLDERTSAGLAPMGAVFKDMDAAVRSAAKKYNMLMTQRVQGNIITYTFRRAGKVMGTLQRQLEIAETPDGPRYWVLNKKFELDESLQGKKFGELITKNLESVYERNGVTNAQLVANIDVGAYAWAKKGFDYNWDKYNQNVDYGSLLALPFTRWDERFREFFGKEPGVAGHVLDITKTWKRGMRMLNMLREADPKRYPKVRRDFEIYMRRMLQPDPDPAKRPTPAELAMIGYYPNAEIWFGKALLSGSGSDVPEWEGIRQMPGSPVPQRKIFSAKNKPVVTSTDTAGTVRRNNTYYMNEILPVGDPENMTQRNPFIPRRPGEPEEPTGGFEQVAEAEYRATMARYEQEALVEAALEAARREAARARDEDENYRELNRRWDELDAVDVPSSSPLDGLPVITELPKRMDMGTPVQGPDGVIALEQLGEPGQPKPPDKPLRYLYRSISEEEWEEIKRTGYLQSDGRMNLSADEGTVTDVGSPEGYLPNLPGMRGRTIRIQYNPDDGWRLDGRDSYVKTSRAVPADRIDAVTEWTYGNGETSLPLEEAVQNLPYGISSFVNRALIRAGEEADRTFDRELQDRIYGLRMKLGEIEREKARQERDADFNRIPFTLEQIEEYLDVLEREIPEEFSGAAVAAGRDMLLQLRAEDAVDISAAQSGGITSGMREAAAEALHPDSVPDGWQGRQMQTGASEPYLWTNDATGERMIVKKSLNGKYPALEKELIGSGLLRGIGLEDTPEAAVNRFGRVVMVRHAGDRYPESDPPKVWSDLSPEEKAALGDQLADPWDAVRLLLGDVALVNADRNPGNLMIGPDADGRLRLFPIDHGSTLRRSYATRDKFDTSRSGEPVGTPYDSSKASPQGYIRYTRHRHGQVSHDLVRVVFEVIYRRYLEQVDGNVAEARAMFEVELAEQVGAILDRFDGVSLMPEQGRFYTEEQQAIRDGTMRRLTANIAAIQGNREAIVAALMELFDERTKWWGWTEIFGVDDSARRGLRGSGGRLPGVEYLLSDVDGGSVVVAGGFPSGADGVGAVEGGDEGVVVGGHSVFEVHLPSVFDHGGVVGSTEDGPGRWVVLVGDDRDERGAGGQ